MRNFVFNLLLWVAEIAAVVFGCLFILPIYLIYKLVKKTGLLLKKIVRRPHGKKASGNEKICF